MDDDMGLPPLPHAKVCYADHSYPAYSAAQMREYALAARSAATAAADAAGFERGVRGAAAALTDEAAHMLADANAGLRNGTEPGVYETASEWLQWAAEKRVLRLLPQQGQQGQQDQGGGE